MTIYTVFASDLFEECETAVELFASADDAIAYVHSLYLRACADSEIEECEWHDDEAFPSCSWFDCRITYRTTCVWIETREIH